MFIFSRTSRNVAAGRKSRRRSGGPVTIGFEQLEAREMLSPGVSLTIIPTETWPLLSMPRPYIGQFDPVAERAVTVSLTPQRAPEESSRSGGLLSFGRRFRFRF